MLLFIECDSKPFLIQTIFSYFYLLMPFFEALRSCGKTSNRGPSNAYGVVYLVRIYGHYNVLTANLFQGKNFLINK